MMWYDGEYIVIYHQPPTVQPTHHLPFNRRCFLTANPDFWMDKQLKPFGHCNPNKDLDFEFRFSSKFDNRFCRIDVRYVAVTIIVKNGVSESKIWLVIQDESLEFFQRIFWTSDHSSFSWQLFAFLFVLVWPFSCDIWC